MHNRIKQIISEISSVLVERDSVVGTMWRALLSRQHVLLLGAPGIAKTLVTQLTIERITDAKLFKWLLRRDSTCDEVFGPVSLKGLEQDIYRRNISGKLPEAHLGILEEIFNSNSTLLNGLLGVINERHFENGGTTIDVPLLTLCGTSNQDAQGEELGAFRDRFLVVLVVRDIADAGSFRKFLEIKTTPPVAGIIPTTITLAELMTAIKQVKSVIIPPDVLDAVSKLRSDLHKIGIRPSPRRFASCLDYLKSEAFLDGRAAVDVDDLPVLRDALWVNQDSIPDIIKILASISNPDLGKIISLLDAARETFDKANSTTDPSTLLQANTDLRAGKNILEGIVKGTNSEKVKIKGLAAIDAVKGYHKQLLVNLGMSAL